ncbi:MAG TPA: serine/threonine-protein kinase [bacterium]|nr:serine/threonine-protein kinase [bacterium]
MEAHRVGRYALVKLIGRGGMADVWIGKAFGASGFEKIVAIKLLAPYNVDKEDYQRALTDEARILVNLKHPNIVDVYDLNFEAENPYLVMEFVEGTELRDVLRALRAKKQRLPLKLANYVIAEVSKALAHAHERKDPQTGRPLKIVHRDVSPSNILISAQGDVKLSDFGIAKSALQSGQTQVGLIKGKFRYMSPEQAEGRALDGRSDLFSLGLVFYECLFGAPAYEASSDVGVLQMARTGSVAIPKECDPDLRSVFTKMLAPKASERFADLNVFRRALTEAMSRRGEMGDRESFAEFLGVLDLPQLRKAGEIRRQAEDWDPQPTSQILTGEGTLRTLAEEALPRRRKKLYVFSGAAAAVGAAAVVFLLAADPFKAVPVPPEVAAPETWPVVAVPVAAASSVRTQGTLFVETAPPDAAVEVKFGDRKIAMTGAFSLPEIPFGAPVEIMASKKGFRSVSRRVTFSSDKAEEKLTLTLPEIKDVQVRFVADPYAEVSVPGQFSGVETPIASRRLPPGDYDVTFSHGPSGHRAVARIKGREGGNFLCSANMAVEDASAAASASCRPR